uniref:CTNNB1_binding domain-containing protein n=1 Tax=Syphacia muris TaxID=451379 RepID=A0A0N5AWL9_9BILA
MVCLIQQKECSKSIGMFPVNKFSLNLGDKYEQRRSDADDVETAQSTHQLTEDKKEVALEAELEAKGAPAFIASKSGAFVKPSPSYHPLTQISPNFAPVPFFPFLVPGDGEFFSKYG